MDAIDTVNNLEWTGRRRGGQLRTIILAGILAFTGCSPKVTVETGSNFITYRAKRVRVYISSDFVKVLGGQSEKVEGRFHPTDIGILFERGVLTGEMFVAALGEKNLDTPVRQLFHRRQDSVDEALGRDPGPLMKVLNCLEIPVSGGQKNRQYDLWVTFDANETGWGSFHHFLVSMENKNAAHSASAVEFLCRARLVSLEYRGMEL